VATARCSRAKLMFFARSARKGELSSSARGIGSSQPPVRSATTRRRPERIMSRLPARNTWPTWKSPQTRTSASVAAPMSRARAARTAALIAPGRGSRRGSGTAVASAAGTSPQSPSARRPGRQSAPRRPAARAQCAAHPGAARSCIGTPSTCRGHLITGRDTMRSAPDPAPHHAITGGSPMTRFLQGAAPSRTTAESKG
jgi:hypothetical protein